MHPQPTIIISSCRRLWNREASMDRAFILAFGLCFLSASVAFAQDLPEGTSANTDDGCKALAGRTPAELGEDLDFQVLSKKGLVAYQQVGDFVGGGRRGLRAC